MRRAWRRVVGSVVVCLAGTGCYSYQRSALPSPETPDQSLGSFSRITTRSGAIYSLVNASVVGDSVIGLAESNNARVAIAVSDVDRVARWGEDGGKTLGMFAGIVGVVVLSTLAVLLVLFSAIQ